MKTTVNIEKDLKRKTVYALSWNFLQALAQRGVQFVVGIVLARLLLPEQFGLIAMIVIFMAVAQAFIDSGFSAALIQKREATTTDINSVFYFNIVIGIVAAGLLCWIAPWIATFYNQPILTSLMRALSLIIVINSFSRIQDAILRKQISFKTLTTVGVIASILSGFIGITLAVFGFGVWSLVAQQVSAAFFTTVFLWLLSSWRPTLIFSFSSLRGMFRFGSRLLFVGILNQVFDNIYFVVIGRLYSPTDLGLFTRAATMNDLPSRTLSEVVARVTFPVFSIVQDDPTRLKRGLKKAVTNLALVNFPMMIGLAVVAHPLVLVLLTEKWLPCVPYLQLLCMAGLLYPLHQINLNVLQALGRSDLFLRLAIIKKVMIVINIAITWRWGISAMICGMIAISTISYYLNNYYNDTLISYPIREQVLDLFPYLVLSVLMGSAVYATGLLQFPNHLSLLLVQITMGIFIYVCACRAFRLRAFMSAWYAIWNRMPLVNAETTR